MLVYQISRNCLLKHNVDTEIVGFKIANSNMVVTKNIFENVLPIFQGIVDGYSKNFKI